MVPSDSTFLKLLHFLYVGLSTVEQILLSSTECEISENKTILRSNTSHCECTLSGVFVLRMGLRVLPAERNII
jgi:hypothetical protein